MNLPIVSILMTAYNRERFIGEAIESVLLSDFPDFELIITDDKSEDSTLEIALSYAAIDPRIRVIENKQNLGDYPNRNHAAKYALGKYLKFVDSDDLLYKSGLKYCVSCMERFPESSWAIIFPNEIATEYLLEPREAIFSHFFKEPFLKAGPGQTILNRTFFDNVGKYPIKYGPANDMYFNLKAASIANTLVMKDDFLFYRRHGNQQQSDQFSYLYNYNKYLKDALDELDLPLYLNEKKWLTLKRKRRFAVNITKYFLEKRDANKTKEAIQRADFSLKDFLQGIFHYSPKPQIISNKKHFPSELGG